MMMITESCLIYNLSNVVRDSESVVSIQHLFFEKNKKKIESTIESENVNDKHLAFSCPFTKLMNVPIVRFLIFIMMNGWIVFPCHAMLRSLWSIEQKMFDSFSILGIGWSFHMLLFTANKNHTNTDECFLSIIMFDVIYFAHTLSRQWFVGAHQWTRTKYSIVRFALFKLIAKQFNPM